MDVTIQWLVLAHRELGQPLVTGLLNELTPWITVALPATLRPSSRSRTTGITGDGTIMTGKDFVAALNAKSLELPTFIQGMAKPHESRADAVMVALGDCSQWHELTTSAILRVEVLGERRCEDHYHPLVRMELDAKHPQASTLLNVRTDCQMLATDLGRKICEALRDYPDDPAAILRHIAGQLRYCCEHCVRQDGGNLFG